MAVRSFPRDLALPPNNKLFSFTNVRHRICTSLPSYFLPNPAPSTTPFYRVASISMLQCAHANRLHTSSHVCSPYTSLDFHALRNGFVSEYVSGILLNAGASSLVITSRVDLSKVLPLRVCCSMLGLIHYNQLFTLWRNLVECTLQRLSAWCKRGVEDLVH